MKLSGRHQTTLRRIALLVLTTLLLAGASMAHAGKKKKSHNGDAGASPSPTPPRLNIPIPVNHNAQGVTFPYYDPRHRLEMDFWIKSALRVDLNHLDMEDAFLQTYDDKGVPDAGIFMNRSMLDLNTEIVTSDVPAMVSRWDFEIIGQKMTFDTQKHIGHMSGHVRTIIYSSGEMSASSSPSPTTASQPSASPQ